MIDLHQQISANFRLGEFLWSERAFKDSALQKLQLNPPIEVIANINFLVRHLLQPVRDFLNCPVEITSGYRSPALNELIAGSNTSQHCLGEAADCRLSAAFLTDPIHQRALSSIEDAIYARTGQRPRRDLNANYFLFALICLKISVLPVDQMIHEYGIKFGRPAWIHVSATCCKQRKEILAVGEYTGLDYLKMHINDALTPATSATPSQDGR